MVWHRSVEASDSELLSGFVRLSFARGRPAIVVRGPDGRLTTTIVASHAPYKRAIARESARRHRGALDRLAAYDQSTSLPPSVAAER
jgi:hypothetical protein